MAKLAFLGLGVMGYPMAGHLKAAGHEVTVYNRTASKAEAWADEHGGSHAPTPREAVAGAEFVMACVGNDDDLRSVVLGEDGALAGMGEGAVFVDHTTVSAIVTRELAAEAAKAGIGWVDAPVSGGQAGAENGQLVVMCGGDEAHFAAAAPVIDAYSKMTERFGDVGAGQITKMVNQICIVGAVQSISEGLWFARTAGLDAKKVAKLVSQGAGGSWQLANRADTMIDNHFEHGFAVDWMRKDLGIALQQGKEMGLSLPVTALVDQFYAEVQQLGGGRWDTSSLIQRFRRMHGEEV
ncbi:NAD(P)-dependent oxidoreductase [Roseibacterium sp. SDUM158017]|uniref:NAD(P)-dependent oxidoreductase n=1 Tax=Roseicyclus salinarum TaxID=3036773 RepID=UPI0024151F86|nr:NAD(P)-dependent oxidoreductase [Roseibacterium sp. SDUM158017]MDG4647382.1 NAD(P)-dependent oxidoreductase [Roseibacterium sp. SDUM158017]